MRTWGKYSYAMYIFQLPMFAMAQKFGLTPEQLPSAWGSWIPSTALFSACMTIAVTFAAWLSWNLYEKHFMALKRYFAN
jgi:peptidoglycan/LPS O-acetylase OafA/YrhL